MTADEDEPEFFEPIPAEEAVPDETPNAASPKSIRKSRDKAKRSEDESADFWRKIMGSPVGRREMWKLLIEKCGAFRVDRPCSPAGFPDEKASEFARGQQALGQQLYQDLMVFDAEGVVLMHRECDARFAKPARRS